MVVVSVVVDDVEAVVEAVAEETEALDVETARVLARERAWLRRVVSPGAWKGGLRSLVAWIIPEVGLPWVMPEVGSCGGGSCGKVWLAPPE